MKIAFVGKGGSGKSTMISLFITYLHNKVGAEVLACTPSGQVGQIVRYC